MRFSSVSYCEHADLTGLFSAPRHSEIKTVQWRRESGSCSVSGRRYARELPVVVGIALFDDVNKALAAGDVYPLTCRIVKEVVRKTVDRNFRNRLACEAVQYNQPRRLTPPEEQALVCFIQTNGSVPFHALDRPRREQNPCTTIYDRDLRHVRNIRKQPHPSFLNRDTLRRSGQWNLPHQFSLRNSDDSNGRLAGSHAAYVKLLCARIVLDVVEPAPDVDSGTQVKV